MIYRSNEHREHKIKFNQLSESLVLAQQKETMLLEELEEKKGLLNASQNKSVQDADKLSELSAQIDLLKRDNSEKENECSKLKENMKTT